jgi:hypothetical protein
MTFRQSTQAALNPPIPNTDSATELLVTFGDFVVPAGLAVGDIIEMCPLPANMVPVAVIVDFPDLDTGTGITFDAGIISGNWQDAGAGRTMGSEFFLADTTARTGGIARATKIGSTLVAPTTNDRSIGLKMSAAVGTALNSGGTIRLTLEARPMIEGK